MSVAVEIRNNAQNGCLGEQASQRVTNGAILRHANGNAMKVRMDAEMTAGPTFKSSAPTLG